MVLTFLSSNQLSWVSIPKRATLPKLSRNIFPADMAGHIVDAAHSQHGAQPERGIGDLILDGRPAGMTRFSMRRWVCHWD